MGACPERGGGFLALVGQDFAVGQAGVIVDGGMQVAVADDGVAVAAASGRGDGGLAVAPAGLLAVDAPAAAVGDVAEFLDVHVHQLARGGALITAHPLAAGPVQVSQRRAAVAGQHRMHGGGGQAQPERDPRRAQPLADTQLDDPPLRPHRRAGRAGLRPRRPVSHPGRPALAVAARPPPHRRMRDLESLRRPPQRPAILHHTPGQAQPPGLTQRGITVDHEDLPGLACRCGDPHRTRRSSPIQDHPAVSPSPTSVGRTTRYQPAYRHERLPAWAAGTRWRPMARLALTLACGDYDRTRPLADGRVTVEGADLTVLTLGPEEIFFRMVRFEEFDVAELSLSTYVLT